MSLSGNVCAAVGVEDDMLVEDHPRARARYSVAPELVTSPVQYDQKCDAWSAGVVIIQIYLRTLPFCSSFHIAQDPFFVEPRNIMCITKAIILLGGMQRSAHPRVHAQHASSKSGALCQGEGLRLRTRGVRWRSSE